MDASLRWSSSRALNVLALLCLSFFCLSASAHRSPLLQERFHRRLGDNSTDVSLSSSASTSATVSPTVHTDSSSSSSSSSQSSSSSSHTISPSSRFLPAPTTETFSHTTTVPPSPLSTSSSQPPISRTSTPSPPSAIASQGTLSTQPFSPSPSTTIALTENLPTSLETSAISNPSATNNSNHISAATNSPGFWQKKGVVAATFVIVALVIAAVSAILFIFFVKRNRIRQEALHHELFEQFTDTDIRGNSPTPSFNSAPMNPFIRRDVAYDSAPPFQNYAVPVQHPDYYNHSSSNQPSTRYLAPSMSQATGGALPSHVNPGRDSYQPSIDSFYGAAGQPAA